MRAQVHLRSEATRRAPPLRPGFALRQALARGYGRADPRAVPTLDATALVGLESAFDRLARGQVFVMLGGVQQEPLRAMARAGWRDRRGRVAIYRSFERAVDEARKAFE